MGLFNLFGKKATLEEMAAYSAERKIRNLSTLKTNDVTDVPVYVNGHWEIQYLIGVPDELIDSISQNGNRINSEFGAASFENRSCYMLLLLFRFDHNPKFSYGTIASVDSVGEKKTKFAGLNYLDILLSQKTISYTLKGSKHTFDGTITNTLLKYPDQVKTIRDSVGTSLKKRGHNDYQMQRIQMISAFAMQAYAESGSGDYLGQKLWKMYEKK